MSRAFAPLPFRDAVEALSLLAALAAPFVAFFAKALSVGWGFGLGYLVAGAWLIVPIYVVLAVLTFRRLLNNAVRFLSGRVLVAAWGFTVAIIGLTLGVEDGGAEASTRRSVLGDVAGQFGLRWAVVEPLWGPMCSLLTVACCLWLIVELALGAARPSHTARNSARPLSR